MNLVNPGKLKPLSLSDAVRDGLMRMIAEGSLHPGDRLNEAHLAERFGISRGPVREAAKELEGQGFLVSRPNQGFYVAHFTPAEIAGIYEAKAWLEDAFIADLAAHMDIAARKSILADIDAIDESDRIVFFETLFEFRRRVCAKLHNRFLAELMIALYRKFYIIAAVVIGSDDASSLARIAAALRRFWSAMAEDDLAGARAVMAEDTAYWLADLLPRFEMEARS